LEISDELILDNQNDKCWNLVFRNHYYFLSEGVCVIGTLKKNIILLNIKTNKILGKMTNLFNE